MIIMFVRIHLLIAIDVHLPWMLSLYISVQIHVILHDEIVIEPPGLYFLIHGMYIDAVWNSILWFIDFWSIYLWMLWFLGNSNLSLFLINLYTNVELCHGVAQWGFFLLLIVEWCRLFCWRLCRLRHMYCWWYLHVCCYLWWFWSMTHLVFVV